MARSGGFEPPTAWFVARYSIQLSYERVVVVANYSDLPWLRQHFFLKDFFKNSFKIRKLPSFGCWPKPSLQLDRARILPRLFPQCKQFFHFSCGAGNVAFGGPACGAQAAFSSRMDVGEGACVPRCTANACSIMSWSRCRLICSKKLCASGKLSFRYASHCLTRLPRYLAG